MRQSVLVVVLAGTLVVAGCAAPSATDDRQLQDVPPGELEIHHIDVGQGDATLLIGPDGETMLIDSGRFEDNGTSVLAYLKEQNVSRIDHLVTTHPHADHIGGHEAIIETYERRRGGIGTIYDPGTTHTTETYDEYLTAVERHDVRHRTVHGGDSIPFGETNVTVLHPPEDATTADLNDRSLVLLVAFGETEYLTTGDSEARAESRLVSHHAETIDAEVYQVAHHGSSTSSDETFLESVDPEIAVISSAGNSPYGHPHDSTLERFAEHDIRTYWTGAHGDTVVTTDGENVRVDIEADRPTDPGRLLDLKPINRTAPRLDPTAGGSGARRSTP